MKLLYGDCQLYEHDIQSLNKGNWINDSIIEFQYEFLETSYPTVSFIRPAVVSLLYRLQSDFSLELNTKDLIFFPINDGIVNNSNGSHWSLLVYTKNRFYHYDSMNNLNLTTAETIVEHSLSLILDCSNIEPMDCINQDNSYDCGVFLIAITKHLALKYSVKKELNREDLDISNEKFDSNFILELRNNLKSHIQSLLP